MRRTVIAIGLLGITTASRGAEPSYLTPPSLDSEVITVAQDPGEPSIHHVRHFWTGTTAAAYFIKTSEDLEEWFYVPEVLAGINEEMEFGSFDVTGVDAESGDPPAPAQFLAVVAVRAEAGDPEDGDADQDGLTNGEELVIHVSDPLSDDTDGDGYLDGEEFHLYGSSLFSEDGDGDGLTDAEEVALGLNPMLADTDGDGVDDASDPLPLVANESIPADITPSAGPTITILSPDVVDITPAP